MSIITALAIAITLGLGIAATTPAQAAVTGAGAAHRAVHASTASKKDVDCSDFPNQASAQAYFLAHGGPGYDPNDLDGDGNGIACESNPCPCSTSQTTGGGGDHGGGTGGTKCTTIPPSRGSKPLHKLTASTKKVSGGKFAVYGAVRSLPNGQLSLFKATGKNGHYCLSTKGPTRGNGSYQISFSGSIGSCYKLVVPSTGKHRETVRFVGCIVKKK